MSVEIILLAERWKKQEVPDFDGVVCASGELYVFDETSLVRGAEEPAAVRWIDVAILAVEDLYGGKYRVVCGESSAHGSIGVVVLEDAESGAPLWSFVSSRGNPFDQIGIKADYVLVLSTSGTVFRFRPPLEEVRLFIP